jgi:hypothetical protein
MEVHDAISYARNVTLDMTQKFRANYPPLAVPTAREWLVLAQKQTPPKWTGFATFRGWEPRRR